jgi:hypothetical protein
MGIIGMGISIAAAFFMLIGLIPFLGWLNWITTLPLATVGVAISGIATGRTKSLFGMAGLVIGVVVIFIAAGRLFIGCGIF